MWGLDLRCVMWDTRFEVWFEKCFCSGQCRRVRSVVGGEGCRLQVSSCRFQVLCERWQSRVKRSVVQSCCVKCHAWAARCRMCGVKSEVRNPRCEKACTTYPTPYIAYILKPYVLCFTLPLTFHNAHLALRCSHFEKQCHNPYVFCSCVRCVVARNRCEKVSVRRKVWKRR